MGGNPANERILTVIPSVSLQPATYHGRHNVADFGPDASSRIHLVGVRILKALHFQHNEAPCACSEGE